MAADFGDGGAFPEIHFAQYPMDMGRPDPKSGPGKKSNALAVQLDAEGKVKYDLIARQVREFEGEGCIGLASPPDSVPSTQPNVH